MTMTCKACAHPRRSDLDQALVAGTESLRNIAVEFGLSLTGLHRHAGRHVPRALAKAAEAGKLADASSLLSRVRLLEAEAWSLLGTAKQKAEAADAGPATLQAASGLVGRLVDVLTLFGKLSGELMEKHLHAHAHRHEAAELPPALALQFAAEELCDRASELDEATRRALVVRLLEPPAIDVLPSPLENGAKQTEGLQ